VDAHCAPFSSSTSPASAEYDPSDALLLRVDSLGSDLLGQVFSVDAFCGLRVSKMKTGESRPPVAGSASGVEHHRRTSFDHYEKAGTPAARPGKKEQS
jgi:hypothetical protein